MEKAVCAYLTWKCFAQESGLFSSLLKGSIKLIRRMSVFSIIFTSTLAFGAEVLVCNIGIALPDAQKLTFVDLTSGVRLISEIYTPAATPDGSNLKNFEIGFEEKGLRDVAFVLRSDETTSRAPLNVSLNIDSFYGDENFESMELSVRTESFVGLENSEYTHRHASDMFCYRGGADQKCIGNFGYGIEKPLSKPIFYFSYSIYCMIPQENWL